MTISLNTGLVVSSLSSVAPSGVPSGAPSWYSATTMSASPLSGSPSLSWSATSLTEVTGFLNCRPSMPDGVTSDGVSWVTAPMTPTLTPLTVTMS